MLLGDDGGLLFTSVSGIAISYGPRYSATSPFYTSRPIHTPHPTPHPPLPIPLHPISYTTCPIPYTTCPSCTSPYTTPCTTRLPPPRLPLTLTVLFALGVALQTGDKTVAGFAVGRVFAGIGVGGVSCLVPIYQAECAPRKIRGFIVSAFQFFITLGLLIAAIVVNATKDFNNPSAYQIPIGIQFIWGAIIVVGTFILPESPRWLFLKGKTDRGMDSLARLIGAPRDSVAVQREYESIVANLEHERNLTTGSGWSDCLKQGESKTVQRIATGMALQGLQQLTGINFIFYYGTAFFRNSGITNPFIITIATNVVNTGATPIGMWAADKVGRRPLMLIGAAGMAACQLIVAITGTVISVDNEAGQKVLIAFVCIYIAFFATTCESGRGYGRR